MLHEYSPIYKSIKVTRSPENVFSQLESLSPSTISRIIDVCNNRFRTPFSNLAIFNQRPSWKNSQLRGNVRERWRDWGRTER